LFGANEAATESLKQLQEIYNNSEVEVKISNENAKLKTPENAIETYRSYADKGGGRWKIIVEKNNKKKEYNSSSRVIKITIEGEEKADPVTLMSALKQFLERDEEI